MNILLGVTGGIAAYKAPTIISSLRRSDCNVKVVVTESALDFVAEMSLSTMSANPVVKNLKNELAGEVTHIELANWCDIFAVVPCTANFIAKMAHGIADDALSTIHLALPEKTPKRICPAMNNNMWSNRIVQKNISILSEDHSYNFLEPATGLLACGVVGKGKFQHVGMVIKFITSDKEII